MNKFIVRNINNTPAKRLNKKNTNKYYFDVYDSNPKKIVERIYAQTKQEADEKRVRCINKINTNIYTVINAVLSDAAQIEDNIQIAKRDKNIIKENTLRDSRFAWDIIKKIKHNGVMLKDYPVKNISVEFLTSLEKKFLTTLSLRQNKSSWSKLGSILNVAAQENMGVQMYITKKVSRNEFNSAYKRRIKKVPDILKTDNPKETIDLINKVLDCAKLQKNNFYFVTLRTLLETNQRISRIIPIEKNDFSTKINGFVIDKSIDVKTNVVEYLPRVYETDFANKGFANVVFVSEEYTKIFLDWLQEIKEWHNPRDLFLPAANGNYSWYHIILQNIKDLFKQSGWNGNISTHDFRSLGAKFRKYLDLDSTSLAHLDHSSKHMTVLYERGNNWKDVKSLTAASNKIGKFYKN